MAIHQMVERKDLGQCLLHLGKKRVISIAAGYRLAGTRSLVHANTSGFAHAFGRLPGSPRTHLLFDPATDVRVDAFPVIKGAFQHRATHTAEQAASHLFDQVGALLVVEYLAYQSARLAEVVILRMQGIGAAYH